MTVDEFLANGGTITKCPTVFLTASINARDLKTGVSSREEGETGKWKNAKGRARGCANAAMRPRAVSVQTARHNANNAASAQERLAMLRRAYDAGITVKEIAMTNCISVDRVKKLLRATGVSFKPIPQGRKPRAEKAKAERVARLNAPLTQREKFEAAEMVRLYVECRYTINQVAEAMGCSNITVRRACSLAGVTRIQGKRPYSPIQAAELAERKAKARSMRAEGKSFREIATIMGRNHETIRGYCDDEVAGKRLRNGRVAK